MCPQDLVATAHSVHVLKLPFQTSSHSPDIRMPHTEGTSVASDYGTLLLGLRLKALVPSLPSVMVLDYLSNSRFLMDARPLKEEPKPKQVCPCVGGWGGGAPSTEPLESVRAPSPPPPCHFLLWAHAFLTAQLRPPIECKRRHTPLRSPTLRKRGVRLAPPPWKQES